MRSSNICEACRRRHRKCVKIGDSDKCNACVEADLRCVFASRIRFKYSQTPRRLSAPSSFSNVTFVTSGLDDGRQSPTQPKATRKQRSPPANTANGDVSTITEDTSRRSSDQSRSSDHDNIAFESDTSFIDTTPDTAPTAIPKAPGTNLTQREAALLKTYIKHLAPSSDACDELQHFSLVVPRLALKEPMILNGILALASSYDSRRTDTDRELESTYYHNLCIKDMIHYLSLPPETWDSTLLAAVVIARLYEEWDNEADSNYYHLSGTSNLLSHAAVARFVTQGGLAEAASWVHLRQAIYVSIVCRKPLAANLDNFLHSTAFRTETDSAHANRMVLLLCRSLQLFFPSDSQDSVRGRNAAQADEWEQLDRQVEEWYRDRPRSFQPLYCDTESTDHPRIVTIYMLSQVTVVGLQHYFAYKVISCLHQINSLPMNTGYDAIKTRTKLEATITGHLCRMMGLAMSNPETINAFYLPVHMLSLCGYCIRDSTLRETTLQYLDRVTEVVQWKTGIMKRKLETEWKDLDLLEKRQYTT